MSIKEIENYNQDFASVWAAMDRTEKQMAENAKRMAEIGERVDTLAATVDKSYAEFIETRKEVGKMGNSYGMYVESYFFESLKKSMQFGDRKSVV